MNKYVAKLGVDLTEEARTIWKIKGQNNPFYYAMVEEFDFYAGKMFDYPENTEDPHCRSIC